MSYILDALTKSQKERKRTSVPTLATEYPFEDTPPSSSKRWTSITMIGLTSMAVLIAFYALTTRPPTENELSSAPSQQHSQSESTLSATQSGVTAESVTPMPSRSSNPVTAEEKLLAARAESTNPDGVLLAEPSRKKSKTAAPQPSRSSLAEQRSAQQGAPAQKREGANTRQAKSSSRAASQSSAETAALQPANVSPDEPRLSPELQRLEDEMLALRREAEQVEQMESQARSHRAVTSSAAPVEGTVGTVGTVSGSEPDRGTRTSAATSTSAELPTLRDLPPEVRSNLPPLQIIAHAYAQTSSERMVIINMKRYGEGDRMREGPSIDAITPTGVLLTFQGQQFQVPAR